MPNRFVPLRRQHIHAPQPVTSRVGRPWLDILGTDWRSWLPHDLSCGKPLDMDRYDASGQPVRKVLYFRWEASSGLISESWKLRA